MTKRARRWIILCASISFLMGLFSKYVDVYYHTDVDVLNAYNAISVERDIHDGMITYGNKKSKIGIIFYPGGKVEYTAYEPLMKKLAEKGFFCVLIEMPYNLAVFGIDSADDVQDMYPKVGKWYMMGHSLGGSMAGTYLVDNYRDYDGLILLASYVSDDITHTGLDVISIRGTEDKILDMRTYNKYLKNLPDKYEEMIIQGGNHSYFGTYGLQSGDGIALITNEEQIRRTSVILDNLLLK